LYIKFTLQFTYNYLLTYLIYLPYLLTLLVCLGV